MTERGAGAAPVAGPGGARRPSPGEFALFVAVPLVLTVMSAIVFRSLHTFAGDFHKEFWPAGLRVLHGQTPYVLDRAQIADGRGFPYPPPAAIVMAAFALLPLAASEVVFTVLCFACLFAALRVLEVEDRRVYGVVLLWAPVVNAWQSANLTLPLVLLLALVWRHRNRPAVAGALVALAVGLKPFVWPIALWLLATRRFRAAAVALGTGIALNALAAAVLGPDQIGRYVQDARKVTPVFYSHAYTPTALVRDLGSSPAVAAAVGAVIAACAAALCVLAARRRGERQALAVAVAVMLLASPVLWMHYLTVVLVPLAIACPRLSMLWWLPVTLFVTGSRSTSAWQIIVALLVAGVLLSAAASRRPEAGAAWLHRRPGQGRARVGVV